MSHLFIALLLAGQATAQQATPAAPTLQQLFDQATTAANEERCAEANALFDRIAANAKAMANPMVRAAVEVRKGMCLVKLGQAEAGEAMIRRGLPVLAAGGTGFVQEVRQAHLTLGGLALLAFDYGSAAAEYRQALDISQGRERLRPLMSLSQVLAFDQDGEALRYAGEARALALADPTLDKKEVAAVQTQYARALLNQGRPKEAYAELKDSLRKQGGLGLKVGLSDLTTRSDLAIAAWLNQDLAGARQYLAYTGAGRFQDSPFARASDMTPPLCGPETGLKTDDFAVVQFSLAEDGHVEGVLPIYTTAGRKAAIAFARAVAGWSWKPEVAKAIPALFRMTTRVELRCTTVGERPDLFSPLRDAYDEWLEKQGRAEPGWRDMADARAVPLIRAAVAEARAKGDRPALLQALVELGSNSVGEGVERAAALQEALALGDAMAMPPAARTYIALKQLGGSIGRARRDALRALLARPEVAVDPLAAASVRLALAERHYRQRTAEDAGALLDAVIAEPGLPANHPLKVAALLQLANMAAESGDLAAARRRFEQTGLTSAQCAYIGLRPALRSSGATNDDYPVEAQQMGFEGWVRTEFDVARDGRTVEPRIITAYPAFVFDGAGRKMVAGFRYTSSYRPEGGVACTGQTQSVTFRLFRMP